MMRRRPRVSVDLQAVTKDVKAKIRRVIGQLEAIELQQDLRAWRLTISSSR